ncbi:MAG: DUF2905 domain-containing protein [Desulfitobacteriaceae bacterium]|nr:DUF2905 domain-containing protein [Desulfitobacteriaceae bacterium]MDD4751849.1 DUF2905 domain-containing protein [Desulfitobacteriaceae bacterium]
MDWQAIGRMLIGVGLFIFSIGVVMFAVGKFFNLGGLPGDIVFRKGNFTFYFPLVSCLVISIILTIVLNLIFRR